MPSITIELSQQELDTLTLAARIRGIPSDDWKSFFLPWLTDAYAQVQRTAGTLIADDPTLSAQLLGILSAKLDAESTANQSEATNE